jgi:LPXTG-motif cell wall-anchored protein
MVSLFKVFLERTTRTPARYEYRCMNVMKNSINIKRHAAMLTFCAGIALAPLAASAQTTTPSSGTTTVEQRDDNHNYGWIGLLGLIGLAGLLRKRHTVQTVTR